MKKFTAILLTVIMVASLFTSCSNSIAPNIDETVSVSFDESTSRSLTASLVPFDKDNYFWTYAARKTDDTGLISGQTPGYNADGTGSVPVKTSGEGLTSVPGFSQGSWKFMLFAYADQDYTRLVYSGENLNVVLKKGDGTENKVKVQVSPVQSGEGTLVIANTLSLRPQTSNEDFDSDSFTKFITIKTMNDPVTVKYAGTNRNHTLDAGSYLVQVDFVKNDITYASGSVVATVFSNMTTTVGGYLDELITHAVFDSEINPDVMNKSVYSSSVDKANVPDTGVTIKKTDTSASAQDDSKVTATVTKDAASAAITSAIDYAAGNGVSNATETNTSVAFELKVNTTNATSTSLEYEIGMNALITVKEGNNTKQLTQDISRFTQYVTVTIDIQKGLSNVVVTHDSNEMLKLNSNDQSFTDESAPYGAYFYDATAGKLYIKTKTFSPFSINYDEVKYIVEMNGVKYTSVQAAINAAPEKAGNAVSTITILNNVTAGPAFGFPDTMAGDGKNICIDLNGNTYTFMNPGMGSTGTENQAMHLIYGNKLTLKNGTISISKDTTTIKRMIQNYCDLTLENVTVDCSNAVSSYNNSICRGMLTVKGNTNLIAASSTDTIFDVDGAYCDKNNCNVEVVFDETYTGTTSGVIEYVASTKGHTSKLTINAGTFTGKITSSGANPDIVINGGSFTDLDSAINYASSGATIKLAADVTGKGIGSLDGTKTRDSLTIDFNRHTYTMNDPAVGSTGTKSQAMHWGKSLGSVTLKNGTFKVAENTQSVKMAMQNYINFTAEDMIFDFTKIPVQNYGTGYGEYSGLEVPMFNNNSGKMILKNTVINMPSASTKGISADGDGVDIINCTINGYVNLQESGSSVRIKDSLVNGVVSYFENRYTVKRSEVDGYTVYRNVVNIPENAKLSDVITNATDKNVNFALASNQTINLENGIANEGDKSRNITFIGDGNQTVDVITDAVTAENGKLNYQRGSSFTFENLTIQAGEGSFDGIVCDELTFKNCTIKGKLTLYGKATFTNCVFDNNMANQYSIWTWGGTDVTFENCTFNTNGKAILLYGGASGSNPTNLVVNNCTFNDRNNGTAGKAAIEIGNDYNATYTLTVNNATVNGFAAGKNTGSEVWANKNSMDAAHLTVTIDGSQVQ